MKLITSSRIVLFLAGSALGFGQQPPQPGPPPGPPPMGMRTMGPGGPEGPRRAMRPGPRGKWWENPELARRLGITADQKKRMDDVFLQSRMKLIDLQASMEKDELTLESLMEGPQLDDSKILPEVDKVAEDRAELEKADVRMLLGIRHILTPQQWTALNQGDGNAMVRGRGRGGMNGGPVIRGGPGGPGAQPPLPRQ